MSEPLLRTALYDEHLAAGGRIVPFAGYEMPVQYSSVLAEAKAVREGVGMFDVSHMARLTFTGADVIRELDRLTTNLVASLTDGTGHYSLIPNERGGVVDDIITIRITATEIRMVVNASNHAKDVAWFRAHLQGDVLLSDQTADTVMIAVQGPQAIEVLMRLAATPALWRDAPLFGAVFDHVAGIEVYATRSGYTGEDGFELICTNAHGPALWRALLEAGVVPCGLGSRDTLRVEAGLPLYGHELSDDLSPLAAGLGWVIGKEKTFIGSEAIAVARAEGTPTKLVGIRLPARRLMPTGAEVKVNDEPVGTLVSSVVSPILECGLGFAFVRSDVPLKTACTVDIRGKDEAGTIVGKRFLKRDPS